MTGVQTCALPIFLTRNPKDAQAKLPPGALAYPWSAPGPIPSEALAGADAVVHLAGESIGRWPWTESRKRKLRESRILGTRSLVKALAEAHPRPAALVAASAVGYYGDRGDAWMDEQAGPGLGFLAGLAADWEGEIFRAESLGVRTVALRNGVVLGPGGALAKLRLPFSLGLGTTLGSGQQFFSWIHREDAVDVVAFVLGREDVRGAVNAVAPEPVTNREFSAALARALGRPLLLRVPAPVLRMALGEFSRTLLEGQRVSARKLASLGYSFRYPGLDAALVDIIGKKHYPG